jgi:hypothetical protein
MEILFSRYQQKGKEEALSITGSPVLAVAHVLISV